MDTSRDITLYGVTYSPWTERARWALDHHRIPYRYREHLPMLGEPLLRRRAREAGQPKPTVPQLVHTGGVIGDSLAIMRFADARGSGTSLSSDAQSTADWALRMERGLDAGRARLTVAILADREALRESMLPVSPAPLAGALSPVAAQAARFIARKYGANVDHTHQYVAVQREVCGELREALAGRPHLEGDTLSAKDLLAISFLQTVQPVHHPRMPLLPALRRAWTAAPLVDEFADVLAWRDGLYANQRGERTRAAA